MKWTIKLITEAQPGTLIEEEVLTIERADLTTPATVGLSIAEGKAIMERLQRQIVTAQVQRHGASIESCPRCGKAFARRVTINPLCAAFMARFRCGFGA